MASKIYLRGEELQLSDAKKAADYIDDAVSALRKVDDAVSGWDFYMDNIEVAANGFVFGGSESAVHGCLSALRAAQTKLNKLVSALQTGTEKIEDADAAFENSLTNSGKSKRLRKLIRNAIFPSTILPSVVTWIYDLITPQDTITIEIDPIIDTNPPKLSPGEEYIHRIQALLEEARKENGNDGTKYWKWYSELKGYPWREGWCAAFVSYWMEQAGVDVKSPEEDYEWFLTYPPDQMEFFKSQGLFYGAESDYTPKTGDLVFIDWNGGTNAGHVGMIYVDDTDGKTYLIHGNTGNEGVIEVREYTTYYRENFSIGFGDVAAYVDASS